MHGCYDIVTLGKPMGAGYPIGAVIARREVADALARDYEYFSTFAATPAAAAAGLAVLDVLHNERLPERAPHIGDQLPAGPAGSTAGGHHELLGDVRGTGLIAGVDILGDARGLLEALRDRRVLAGLTGPDGNVLKIRPPLIWRTEHVEVFLAALGSALGAS